MTIYNFGLMAPQTPTPESVEAHMKEFIHVCARIHKAGQLDEAVRKKYEKEIRDLQTKANDLFHLLFLSTTHSGLLALNLDAARVFYDSLCSFQTNTLPKGKAVAEKVQNGDAKAALLWLAEIRESVRADVMVKSCGEDTRYAQKWDPEFITQLIEEVRG